jgi:lipopolysaccharide biosynthesis glycosyltransferase
MRYSNVFYAIIFLSSFLGILFAILNNKIVIITNDKNDINNNHKGKNLYGKTKNKNENNNLLNDDYNYKNVERNNIIPLAINIDMAYCLQAIVFLTSLLENIGPNTKYEVYIMIPDLFDDKSKIRINSLMEKYGKEKIEIQYINMKNSFKTAVTGDHISTTAYYRLLLPSMLPNIDKIIYSDCDVINFEDLTNLYNLQLKDNIYFRGLPDYNVHEDELRGFGVYSNFYMNSGILLMNLKSLRKYGIERKIIDLCDNYYLEHHDQTAINVICSKNIETLPIKYAIFNFESYGKLVEYNNGQNWGYRYSQKELKEAFNRPVMLHFAGFDKPWNHKKVHFEEYWWFYAKKTDVYEDLLVTNEYLEEEVDLIIKKIPENGGFLRNNILINNNP